MKNSSKNIFASQRDIRANINHFVTVKMKIKKTDVTGKLKDGVLPIGICLDAAGKVATGGNAYGVLFDDIDFNDSTGTELAPILIHGFVDKAKIKEYTGEEVAEENIKALNLIKFL